VVQVRDGEVYVTLVTGETGIAPGQACVLYSDDGADAQVLGGGFIAEAVPAALVA
jgi:tRNA-specific 2-thiouridylase